MDLIASQHLRRTTDSDHRPTKENIMTANRRTFLSGVSLGARSLVLSPLVRQLEAQAAGGAKRPQRFVFVMEGNGLPWEQIQPSGIERGGRTTTKGGAMTLESPETRNKLVNLSLSEYSLAKAIDPLIPWKDRVTILQ